MAGESSDSGLSQIQQHLERIMKQQSDGLHERLDQNGASTTSKSKNGGGDRRRRKENEGE